MFRLPSTQKSESLTRKLRSQVGLHSKISDFSVQNRNFIDKITTTYLVLTSMILLIERIVYFVCIRWLIALIIKNGSLLPKKSARWDGPVVLRKKKEKKLYINRTTRSMSSPCNMTLLKITQCCWASMDDFIIDNFQLL